MISKRLVNDGLTMRKKPRISANDDQCIAYAHRLHVNVNARRHSVEEADQHDLEKSLIGRQNSKSNWGGGGDQFLGERGMVMGVERIGLNGQQHGEGDVNGGQAENDESVVDSVKRGNS